MIIDEISEFIKTERKRQRLTQPQLGERCGIHKSNICMLELEKYKMGPSIDTCERLLNALGYRLKIVKID